MKERNEETRLNKLFHLFSLVVLTLFTLLLIGLLEIRVSNSSAAVGSANPGQQTNPFEVGLRRLFHIQAAAAYHPPFAARLIKTTNNEISLQSGETATLTIFLKNNGGRAWRNNGQHYISYYTDGPRYRSSLFRNDQWWSSIQPAKLNEPLVRLGEVGSFTFSLTAPTTPGIYKEKFRAAAENLAWLPKSNLDIIITVEKAEELPVNKASDEGVNLMTEPAIRIGLFKLPGGQVTRLSYDVNYTIQNSENKIIRTVPARVATTLNFDLQTKQYLAVVENESLASLSPLRLVPEEPLAPATILTFEQLPRWSATANDNQFRGVTEIKYASAKNEIWLINELPLEYYLKGLGEASDNFNPEYLKALYTAARTYALFHYTNPYKHQSQGFTLDAVYDQVYRGFKQEKRSPNSSRLIDDVHGIVMTYNNEVIIAPYYSQSDGRTRSWKEVFGGSDKPWLVSVATPSDQGKTLNGHGVGMSASDARARANAGSKFEEILKYFYQNTTLKKMY